MGVDVSALLFYGGRVKDLNNVEIDEVTESEDWEGDNFEEWDADFTDAYNGPCKWTTVIGIDCKGKTLDEIVKLRDENHDKFKKRFGVEPELILEGVVS